MDAALEKAFGCPIAIATDPQFTGALGAALLAETMGVIYDRLPPSDARNDRGTGAVGRHHGLC